LVDGAAKFCRQSEKRRQMLLLLARWRSHLPPPRFKKDGMERGWQADLALDRLYKALISDRFFSTRIGRSESGHWEALKTL
jgi:hypothetical protein